MFGLTPEQEAMRRKAREFARAEMVPHMRQWEKEGEVPMEIFEKLAALGVLGILVPAEYGGIGGDYMTLAVVHEELATQTGAGCMEFAVHASVQFSLLAYGSEEQKRRYLRDLVEGRLLAAFALTEPDAGSDAAAIKTFARRDGDGYVLNGSKRFITNGGRAGLYMVMARTSKERGSKAISAFLVDNGTAGFTFGRIEKKMGGQYSPTRELFFKEVRIPVSARLGQEGDGLKAALANIDGTRICAAALGLGIAQAALNCAIEHAKETIVPVSSFATTQAQEFMLADMAVQVEASRLLVYRAAWIKDSGHDAVYEASMAKLFATDTGMKVASNAVQLLGLEGCMKDSPVERYFREIKVSQIAEGTNEIQRIVISRRLLGIR